MKKSIVFAIFSFIFLTNLSYAFEFKNPFNRKQPPQKIKMVETVEEWKNEAQDIPIDQRELKVQESPKTDDKFYYPDVKYIFEKYNFPQGKRVHDISEIRARLSKTPTIVADNTCRWVAYSQYYFSPDENQISSNFFVGKLDSKKTKTKRILEYNHKSHERKPIIESGTKAIYSNLFNALVLVDWSQDSRKILIKENIGSIYGGIYQTRLYIYLMPDDVRSGKVISLDNFSDAIKNYYLNYENIQIVKYRYSLEPLGFSAENDNMVISLFYIYDNQNNKIFSGTWGYDIVNGETLLISKTNPVQNISANGLVLRQVLN